MLGSVIGMLVQALAGGEKNYVVREAKLICDMGTDEGILNLPLSHGVYIKERAVMNIADHVPEENISTFGFCKAPGNEGAPCEPLTCQKWQYGKDDVLIDEEPALLDSSTLTCTKGGTISIVSDGQE